MIPLFPTQPLALSSGLLFGTTEVIMGKQLPWRITLQPMRIGDKCHTSIRIDQGFRQNVSCSPYAQSAVQGALCTIFSTTLAASIAFSFAQGLGRTFAQKMIDSEVGGEPGKGDNAAQKVGSLRQHTSSMQCRSDLPG